MLLSVQIARMEVRHRLSVMLSSAAVRERISQAVHAQQPFAGMEELFLAAIQVSVPVLHLGLANSAWTACVSMEVRPSMVQAIANAPMDTQATCVKMHPQDLYRLQAVAVVVAVLDHHLQTQAARQMGLSQLATRTDGLVGVLTLGCWWLQV
jgi:hypothetical protein